MSFIGAVGTIGSLILSAYGMSRQEEENKAARSQSLSLRREDIERESQIRKEDIAREREKERYLRREKRREWKWKEEQQNYQRSQDFVNRFMGLLDREPAYRNSLLNVWGRRS